MKKKFYLPISILAIGIISFYYLSQTMFGNGNTVNNEPVNNEPVNNEPVNNEPVNNEPLINLEVLNNIEKKQALEEKDSIDDYLTMDEAMDEEKLNTEKTMTSDTDKEKSKEQEKFATNIQKNKFIDLLNRNSDFVGLIKIDGTPINYPVLKGQDNDYYLKRNIDKAYDYYGSIFMDYRNFGLGFDANLIIYGHNMKDDKMFGLLRKYTDRSYAMDHPLIEFEDLYETREYEIFSVYYAEAEAELIKTSFSGSDFHSYIEEALSRSVHDFNIAVSDSSKIITLVTCSYDLKDGRTFVHAVLKE